MPTWEYTRADTKFHEGRFVAKAGDMVLAMYQGRQGSMANGEVLVLGYPSEYSGLWYTLWLPIVETCCESARALIYNRFAGSSMECDHEE